MQKILDAIRQSKSMEEPMDILKILREESETEEFRKYQDDLISSDYQVGLFNNEVKGVQCIFWNTQSYEKETMGMPRLQAYEPDWVMFQYRYPHGRGRTKAEHILKMLMAFMLSDCTGCCDAMEYLNINKYGIVGKANVSVTYHS